MPNFFRGEQDRYSQAGRKEFCHKIEASGVFTVEQISGRLTVELLGGRFRKSDKGNIQLRGPHDHVACMQTDVSALG
jgi:hypothetical protein